MWIMVILSLSFLFGIIKHSASVLLAMTAAPPPPRAMVAAPPPRASPVWCSPSPAVASTAQARGSSAPGHCRHTWAWEEHCPRPPPPRVRARGSLPRPLPSCVGPSSSSSSAVSSSRKGLRRPPPRTIAHQPESRHATSPKCARGRA
jgi:hypothetical protein